MRQRDRARAKATSGVIRRPGSRVLRKPLPATTPSPPVGDQVGAAFDRYRAYHVQTPFLPTSYPGRPENTSVQLELLTFGQDFSHLGSEEWTLTDLYNTTDQLLVKGPDVGIAESEQQSTEVIPRSAPGDNATLEGQRRISNSKRGSNDTAEETSHKRTRPHLKNQTGHPGDDDEDEDEMNLESTPKATDQDCDDTTQDLTFACPYFRLNPASNQQCLGYKLKRIRDMKQHLLRKHYIFVFYCPRCFLTFQSLKLRDQHIRCQNCQAKPCPILDNLHGVSPEAQKRLKERVNRAATPSEQWFMVWEILFGESGVDRPADPYIRSIVRETFSMVRAFWHAAGSKVMPRILELHPKQNSREAENLQTIIHKVFDEVETHFEESTRNTSPTPAAASSGSQTPTMAMLRSETWSGNSEASSLSSASTSELSLSSWPSHPYALTENSLVYPYLDQHNGGRLDAGPHEYAAPSSMGYYHANLFAWGSSSVFSTTPTLHDTPSIMGSEVSQDYTGIDFLAGVGGGFG